MKVITRRYFLHAMSLSLATLTGILPGCSGLRPRLQSPPAPDQFSFNHFVQLSTLLTHSDSLDPEMSQEIYQAINQESWGPQHLQQIYRRIYQLTNKGFNLNNLLQAENFSEGEVWFISHLLITWYTGVYFHSKRNKHISLQHALMYRKLSHFRQPPTYCGGAPGFWAKPPATLT